MFKLNFPYTTVYPALGNLDVLHPRILEASESSSAFGKTREADHYGSRGHKKRRKWYGNGRGDHHETTTACKYTTNSSILYTLIITRGSAKRAGIGLQLRKQSLNAVAFFLALTSREFLFERLFEFTPGWLRNSRLEKKQLLLASSRERDVSLREFRTNCAKASASPPCWQWLVVEFYKAACLKRAVPGKCIFPFAQVKPAAFHSWGKGDGGCNKFVLINTVNFFTAPEKATYDHVAHLWQNWLPPTAISTLQRGE